MQSNIDIVPILGQYSEQSEQSGVAVPLITDMTAGDNIQKGRVYATAGLCRIGLGDDGTVNISSALMRAAAGAPVRAQTAQKKQKKKKKIEEKINEKQSPSSDW